MENTTKSKSLRKERRCPTCNAGKLIHIVYGLPGRELIVKSGRGKTELGGFVMIQIIDTNAIRSNDPELNCPACNSKFFRSEVLDRAQENDQPIGGALRLEG
jgi:hypothetical protein